VKYYKVLPRDAGGGGGGGGGDAPPYPWPEGCRGVLFFMIKQKIIRDKMRYSNLSNNMMIIRWLKRAIAQKKLTLKEKSHHAKKCNTANKKSYKAT
jgi:hypothetical protein